MADGASRDLALAVGFLLACCLIFGAVAWVAMDYLESDLDRFHRWVKDLRPEEA